MSGIAYRNELVSGALCGDAQQKAFLGTDERL
jgi:hypothetical protein